MPKKDTLAFDRNLMQGCPYLNAKVSYNEGHLIMLGIRKTVFEK